MKKLSEQILHEGVTVDLLFRGMGPGFGDLFVVCGTINPHFPPSGRFAFESLKDLAFSPVEDYFGVRTVDGDVAIWLYPVVNGQTVHHHPGPFDGIRLTYCPLRNPPRRKKHFLESVARMAAALPVDFVYDGAQLSQQEAQASIREDIDLIEAHWMAAGISPGSPEALDVDF